MRDRFTDLPIDRPMTATQPGHPDQLQLAFASDEPTPPEAGLPGRRTRAWVDRQDRFAARPHNSTPTSRAAAEAIGDAEVSRRERQVLEALAERGDVPGVGGVGLTRHEIAEAARMPLAGACGRVNSLIEKQLARERYTGVNTKATRPSPYGKPAALVVITDAGQRVLGDAMSQQDESSGATA